MTYTIILPAKEIGGKPPAVLARPESQSLHRALHTPAPRRGGQGKSLHPLRTPAEGAPHLGGFEEPGWGALTSGERRGQAGGSRTPELAPQLRRAPGTQPRTCTSGAIRRRQRRTKRWRLERPPGGGRGSSWPDSGNKGLPRAGRRGAALTWMVQVYSLSSSSRTVQLYSRSRLLLLPLINLLSIFPPARPPPGETRRRCGPRTRRPSAGQLRAGPKHLHHHPSAIAAAASCRPGSSSFSATAFPQPRANAGLSLLRARLPVSCSWGGDSARGRPMGVSAAEPSGRRKSQ